jgi:hypothetical protein
MLRRIDGGVKHHFRVFNEFTVFLSTVVRRFLLQHRRCRFDRYARKGIRDCIVEARDVIERNSNPGAVTKNHSRLERDFSGLPVLVLSTKLLLRTTWLDFFLKRI